jgi:hypothetical protein
MSGFFITPFSIDSSEGDLSCAFPRLKMPYLDERFINSGGEEGLLSWPFPRPKTPYLEDGLVDGGVSKCGPNPERLEDDRLMARVGSSR